MPPRVHHLSCGSFHPPFARLVDGRGGFFERASYVIHCLLLELPEGLVLVDTGLGAADMAAPLARLGPGMAWGGGATRGTTALEHIRRLGYSAGDVRHIVMTHLDKDHAGGLADFPQATVHIHPAELAAATRRRGLVERQRYSPAHIAHGPHWQPLDAAQTAECCGLPALRIAGLPECILALPLPGHSAGHCGVAIHDGVRWLVHCGDAVYHRAWLDGKRPGFVIQTVESMLQSSGPLRRASRERVRQLVMDGVATVFCSHDRLAFTELGGVE